MNSINEALISKTPMVVIPFSSDQPINAKNVKRAGVGIKLDYSTLNSQLLKNTVLYIKDNKEIKNNLEYFSSVISDSYGNKGGAEIIIDFYNNYNI